MSALPSSSQRSAARDAGALQSSNGQRQQDRGRAEEEGAVLRESPTEQRQSLKSQLQACLSLRPLVQPAAAWMPKPSSGFCGDALRLGGEDANQSRRACSGEDARGPCAGPEDAASAEPLACPSLQSRGMRGSRARTRSGHGDSSPGSAATHAFGNRQQRAGGDPETWSVVLIKTRCFPSALPRQPLLRLAAFLTVWVNQELHDCRL